MTNFRSNTIENEEILLRKFQARASGIVTEVIRETEERISSLNLALESMGESERKASSLQMDLAAENANYSRRSIYHWPNCLFGRKNLNNGILTAPMPTSRWANIEADRRGLKRIGPLPGRIRDSLKSFQQLNRTRNTLGKSLD